MPSAADHIALANRNQGTLIYLLADVERCAEWVAVVAFYKAVHVVEAVFAGEFKPRHSSSHENRADRLKAKPKYANLFLDYRVLEQASRVARYLECIDDSTRAKSTYGAFDDYIPRQAVASMLLDTYLFKVEAEASKFLEPSLGLVRYARSTPPASAPAKP